MGQVAAAMFSAYGVELLVAPAVWCDTCALVSEINENNGELLDLGITMAECDSFRAVSQAPSELRGRSDS